MWEPTNTPLLPRVQSANRSTCLSPSLGCSAASLVSWESEMKHCSSGRGKLFNVRSLQWEEPGTAGTRKDIAHPTCQIHLFPAATLGFVALGTSLPPAIPGCPWDIWAWQPAPRFLPLLPFKAHQMPPVCLLQRRFLTHSKAASESPD